MKFKNWKRFWQLLFIFVSIGLLLLNIDLNEISKDQFNQDYFEGEVKTVSVSDQIQTLNILLQDGPRAKETVRLENDLNSYINSKEYQVGDEVVLVYYENDLGSEQLYIMDYVRRPSIFLLFGIFLGVVLIINRKKGIYSLLSMAFSFLVLFKLVLPLLLKGFDPVFTALLGALFILPAIFYLSHGFNKKASIAIGGTLITLLITGILATIFSELAQLSGLASEEANFLKTGIGQGINFQGLLLAGMIISVLGVLDDVTITQTSVVQQLKAAQKKISFKELYGRSMSVGRDHIASVVNTLILVYTGASLPLLLLFIDSSQTLGEILNLEFIAEEITRTLIGSIGLIFAVPITTFIASLVFHKDEHVECDEHGHVH